MFGLFKRPTSGYIVTVFCDGRHPYLNKKDSEAIGTEYPSKAVQFRVEATDWNDAEKKAFEFICSPEGYKLRGKTWSTCVIAMEREQ